MKTPVDSGLRDFSDSLPMLLLNAHQAVMAQFRPVLREHGITEQQWRVLRALNSAGKPLTLGELSAQTLIMAPSMTRIVRSLDKAGLVQRRIDHNDLRAASLSISARGIKLIQQVAPHSEKRYDQIAMAIGPGRLKDLTQQLRQISTALPPACD